MQELTRNQKIGIGVAVAAGAIAVWAWGSKLRAADLEGQPAYAGAAHKPAASNVGITVYGGLHGGLSMANTELSSVPSSPGVVLDGIGSHGWIGGVHAGFDYTTASKVFFGGFGGYSWQNTESTLTLNGMTTSNQFSFGLGDSYYFGGRVGYDWGKYKVYGLAAWRHTDVEWGVPSGVTIPAALGLPSSMNGIDLGVGAAMTIAPNVELGLEGIWTNYGSEKVTYNFGTPTVPNTKAIAALDTDQLSVMARLSFKFGGMNY